MYNDFINHGTLVAGIIKLKGPDNIEILNYKVNDLEKYHFRHKAFKKLQLFGLLARAIQVKFVYFESMSLGVEEVQRFS